MELLRLGKGNAKLDDAIYTFSLPAGYSCPFARECLSKADRNTGTIRDGRATLFRCYAASMEARRPSVRASRWHNFEKLKACSSAADMSRLILASLSPYSGYVRIHDSGDFFSQAYFDAWAEVARQRPRTTVYAYTKALPFWVRRLGQVGSGRVPGQVPNFVLTASRGGAADHLIDEHGLRSARVVFSREEADALGLELDHDDSHAMRHGPDFALLIHGTQPKGSEAAKAARALRDGGFTGYGPQSRRPLAVVTN